jgi:3-oxoacyl-[acyl-carrier protein] reductase
MDLQLREQVFIVTGGTRGLGRATADCLVAEGARVVLVGRSAEQVDSSVADLGSAAVGLPGDLADPQLADQAIDCALRSFGRLDGALISVGGPPPGSVLTVEDTDWELAFHSVLLGGIRMARRVCQTLIARPNPAAPAAVGLVLSISARQSIPMLSISNALRPGLAMVVSDLADEVGPHGIRVFGLLPGRIATERIRVLDAATGDPVAAQARAESAIPLRRYGTPEEFGATATFLLSPRANYVTGTCIAIDGGMLRMP